MALDSEGKFKIPAILYAAPAFMLLVIACGAVGLALGVWK
jgi:hypothetical protein